MVSAAVETACVLFDLRKDMVLPANVMPTVLRLIDHLHRTRRDFRRLIEALDKQPTETRQAVVAAVYRRFEGRE